MPRVRAEETRDMEKQPYVEKSKMELDCGQVLTKNTRGLFEKMQHPPLGKKTVSLCGHEYTRGQVWVLAGLTILFTMAFTGTMVMWGTDLFDTAVLSTMIIANNSPAFELWKKPTVKPLIKIYLFNYTNLPEYEARRAKLNVQEVGPYIYQESLERVNVKFNDDGTISYQDHRDYKFMPKLSKGRKQSDRIIVPNLPLLTAASTVKNEYFLTRLSMSTLLRTLGSKPFINLPAHRFIWGYDDNLFSLAKSILRREFPYDKIGIMTNKNGTSSDVITINTGAKDINKLGYVKKVNNDETIGHWSTEECNRMIGSDGTLFPPRIVRNKKTVNLYHKDMCRSLPYIYGEEITMLNGKIPAYRYYLPEYVFDRPEEYPENQCYCDLDSGDCPPQGVFNATPCNFGTPAFLSFPHFYMGDPDLRESITGLKPNPKEHRSYIDIHPRWGFAMGGKTKLQMNIQVRKSYGLSQVDVFEDDLILPIAWIELSVEEKDLTEDVVALIFQATQGVRVIELSLQYGSLLTSLFTLTPILIVFKRYLFSRLRRIRSVQPQTHSDSTPL